VIAVRPLRREDETVWRGLWRDYLAFYETERPEEVYAATFARLIDPAVGHYHGLVAHDGETPVGLAHYIFHLHGWQVDEVCYLQDLYVSSQHRGSGAGRALMEAVFAAADAAGRGQVYWMTQTHNAQARRLYDRIGVETPFVKYRR